MAQKLLNIAATSKATHEEFYSKPMAFHRQGQQLYLGRKGEGTFTHGGLMDSITLPIADGKGLGHKPPRALFGSHDSNFNGKVPARWAYRR